MTRSSSSACRATGADSTVTCASANASSDDAVRAGRPHPAADLVVAEDHRAIHRGQRAGRLAEAAVERVRRRVVLDAREQLDEHVECVDADRRRRCADRGSVRAFHPSGHILVYTASWARLRRKPPRTMRRSGSMAVAAPPHTDNVALVRAIWSAYASGGVEAVGNLVGPDVEWVTLLGGPPVPHEQLFGAAGRERAGRLSVTVHGFEDHGDACSPTAACARSATAASSTCSRAGSTSSGRAAAPLRRLRDARGGARRDRGRTRVTQRGSDREDPVVVVARGRRGRRGCWSARRASPSGPSTTVRSRPKRPSSSGSSTVISSPSKRSRRRLSPRSVANR